MMKQLKFDRVTRRQFLKGIGGGFVALPFLPSILRQENAFAQAASPSRLIFIYVGHGALTEDKLYGTMESSIGWTQQQILPGHVIRHGNLPNGTISPLFNASFTPFKNKMSILRGLDTPQYLAHNRALGTSLNFLENPLNHRTLYVQPSIDQFIAQSATFYNQQPTPHRSILTNSGGTWSAALARTGPGNRDFTHLTARSIAHEAYDEIFGTTPTSSGADTTAIDRVFPAYQDLRNSTRISAEDKQRLDSHIQGLHELQQRLQLSVSCDQVPRPPYTGQSTEPTARTNAQNLNSVIVAALRCGQSRIANIFLTEASAPAFNYELHPTIHAYTNPAANQIWFNQVQWQFENVLVDLLSKLNGVVEANGKTMLDNSLVVLHWENYVPHDNYDSNFVLFGGLNGKFQMGKFYDFRNRAVPLLWGYNHTSPGYVGIPQNTLLNSILHAVGIPPSEYEQPRTGAYAYGGYSPFFMDTDWGAQPGGVVGRGTLFNNYYIPTGAAALNSGLLPGGLYNA